MHDTTVIIFVIQILIGLHVAKVILIMLSEISSKKNLLVANIWVFFFWMGGE